MIYLDMSKLTDEIADYFERNGNIPVTPAEICSTLRGEGFSVYEDTIRKMMSLDDRFESMKVEGKVWKRWRMKNGYFIQKMREEHPLVTISPTEEQRRKIASQAIDYHLKNIHQPKLI